MERIITFENIHKFAYVNDKVLKNPIKGIIVEFSGLGDTRMFNEERSDGIADGEKGILFVVPYVNPWSWMNHQAVTYTDEVLDVIMEHFNISKDIPIVYIGGSMGGLSSIVYSRYSKYKPVACLANCPVCDLLDIYNERHDIPRTVYSAFYHENGTIEENIKKCSPLHLIPELPKIPYHIFHCDDDQSVNIRHSETFVKAMKDANYDVTYDIAHNKGHCDLTQELWQKFTRYCMQALGELDK